MGKPPYKPLIFILLVLFLGSAWNVGSRLFLPRASFNSLLQHGIRAYRSGQIDQAFAYFREAATIRPRDAAAAYMLAQSLEAMGREDEAIVHYEKTVALDPSRAAPHYNLAVIYNRRKQYDAAIDELKRALVINRSFHGARFMLGGLYLETAEYAAAADELERLLRNHRQIDRPFEIRTRTFLARAYAGMEETDKAREQWQRILRLDHTNKEAQEALDGLR